MHFSPYKRLYLDKLIPTDISLQMADKSTAIPVGICENVPVQVTTNCLILTDFVVLDMPEDDNMSIIFGRPFLNTAGAVIDCNKGKVTFDVNDKEHTVYFPRSQICYVELILLQFIKLSKLELLIVLSMTNMKDMKVLWLEQYQFIIR